MLLYRVRIGIGYADQFSNSWTIRGLFPMDISCAIDHILLSVRLYDLQKFR
jgi:hypothetical protein